MIPHERKKKSRYWLTLGGMILVIGMTGCHPSQKEVKAEDTLGAEQINGEDPLVTFAMENMPYRFKSDDGRYDRRFRWDNPRYFTDEREKLYIDLMTTYINDGDFETLRELMYRMPEFKDGILPEIRINYTVPILMSESNYFDALRIVQEKYKTEKEDNHRFLFDTVYLEHYLYVNQGFDDAKTTIDTLRETYPSNDLSYIWFGVTQKNFYDLRDNGYCYPFEKGSEDYRFLSQLIEAYPDEPFIDYAYYFLGDYDTIIENYKTSPIYDRAMYARANQAYDMVWGEWKDGYKYVDKNRMDEAEGYFHEYLKTYMNSNYAEYAIRKLLTLYNNYFVQTGDDSRYYDLLYFVQDNKIGRQNVKKEFEAYISSNMECEYENAKIMVEKTEERTIKIDGINKEAIRNTIKTGLAHNAFNHDDLDLAMDYFLDVEYGYYSGWDKKRVDILYHLLQYSKNDSEENLYQMATLLKEKREYELALEYYDKAKKKTSDNDEISRIEMMRAGCYRELDDREAMLTTYESIVENLPKTQYADDALAEIGVYYLLYNKERELARSYFEQVIEKYPGTNAVDDAYNWIAWSYVQDKDDGMALEAYNTLLDEYPETEFGINAQINIRAIEERLSAENH